MYIRVFVTPKAKRDVIIREGSENFSISVRVLAERTMANERVRELVAGEFKVAKEKVRIISGHHRPGKILSVELDY